VKTTIAPLTGWRVVVPRKGEWAERVAGMLRAEGAEPLIAPLIRTEPTHSPEYAQALRRLAEGGYDWLVVTSAAAAETLAGTVPAPGTRVAAVGPATAAALADVGIAVDLVPGSEHSACGLLDAWPRPGDGPARLLAPQSDLASPELADGLRELGHTVDTPTAYLTIPLELDADALAALGSASRRAALVTSGSVATSLAAQREHLPADLVIACIGERTAQAAREAGLEVALIAPERSADALVAALARFAAGRPGDPAREHS